MRRRAVHADTAVPVEGHEAPRRVDPRVDDREVEVVGLRDRRPVVDTRAAEWISPDAHARDPDRIDVDHRGQVVDIVAEVVVPMRRRRCKRPGERHAAHALEACCQQLVGTVLNHGGDVRPGRPAVRRVVLEAAVARGIVTGSDDDAVGAAGIGRRPARVVAQDGVRHGGRGSEAVAGVDRHGDPVGGKHLERGGPCGLAECVTVASEEERSVDSLLLAVLGDRLGRSRDVIVREGLRERRTSMP